MYAFRTRQQIRGYAPALLCYPLWCHSLDFECSKRSEQEWERNTENAKRATSRKKVSFKADTSLPSHKSGMFCHSVHLLKRAYPILRDTWSNSLSEAVEKILNHVQYPARLPSLKYPSWLLSRPKSFSANKTCTHDSSYNDINPFRGIVDFTCNQFL